MRLSRNQRDALKVLGLVLLVGTAVMAPNAVQIFKPRNRKERYKHKRTIKKLFDDNIIFLSGEKIILTNKGKELLKIIEIEDVHLDSSKTKAWDKVWHLVCYDIPEDNKKARNAFRKKLVEWGFKQIQLSLWVYPFECREEVAIVAQNLGIAPFVAYLNTDHLPHQEELITRFHL